MTEPQWEACKICGGDHWTTHHGHDPRAHQTEPKTAACIETTWHRTEDGYGRRWVDGQHVRAHRYAWEQTNGPIPDGMFVLHLCDNPPCVNVEHLFLGTIADNNRDMMKKGRFVGLDSERAKAARRKSTGTGRAKVGPSQIAAIRTTDASQRERARRFGISQSQVGRILRGENWSEAKP